MEAWVECGAEFIEADVIRWTEAIWGKRRRKRAIRIGSRDMIAEVLSRPDPQGWTSLLVRECRTTVEQAGSASSPLKAGSTIKRKSPTLNRGGVERLRWSDESARSIVASRFMNERPELPKETPPVSAAPRRKR